MYIEMPKPPLRLDDLARKIGALAEGLAKLRDYATRDDNRKPTDEEETIIGISHALFDRYSDHIEEYDTLFIKYMQECEMWRKSVQDNSGLIVHMGPMLPASERHRPAAPAMPKGHEPPAWTLTEAELAAKAESELESILSGNK